MKILIMGLPGSGKTSLARELQKVLDAVWWNADEVRDNVNAHLGFTEDDRLQQARSMGWLCSTVSDCGKIAIADFVCPTPKTREAFGEPDVLVWMNTIDASRFEDTNKVFVSPGNPDIIIDYFDIIPSERDTQKPDANTMNRAIREVLRVIDEKHNANRIGGNPPE